MCRNRVSGPSAPAHHSAPTALNGKEDAGGQETYEETESCTRGLLGREGEKQEWVWAPLFQECAELWETQES